MIASGKNIAALLWVALITGSASGQTDRWEYTDFGARFLLARESGKSLQAGFSAKSSSSVGFYWRHGSNRDRTTVSLPMSTVMDYQVLWSTVDAQGQQVGGFTGVLFVGEDSQGKGVVALVRFQQGTFKVTDSKSFAGRSFVGSCFSISKKKIYLVDRTKKEVVQGSFDQANHALPSSLSTVLTSVQCSGLNNATRSRIYTGNDLAVRTILILGEYPSPMDERHWLLIDTGSSPLATEDRVGTYEWPHLGETSLRTVENQAQLTVEGRAGFSFDIISVLTNQVIGSGAIPPSGRATTVVAPLQMGDIYAVKDLGTGLVHGMTTTPVKYWGSSETLPSGFQILDLDHESAMVAEIGAGIDISPSLTMREPAQSPKQSKQWNAWLLVGSEQEVTDMGNGKFVIVSNLSLPDTAVWEPGMQHALAGVELMAPTDPTLAGAIVCYQWMIEEGGNLYFSDVIGIMFRGSIFDPSVLSSNAATSSRSSASRKVKPQVKARETKVLKAGRAKWWALAGARPLPPKIWKLLRTKK